MSGAPKWTAREDRALRVFYPKLRDRERLARALPRRNWKAIVVRASVLGLARDKRWTRAECATLAREWQCLTPRKLREKLSKRTWRAVHAKAQAMGLPMGIPQGHASPRAVAVEMGVCQCSAMRIFADAGIKVRRVYPSGRRVTSRWQGWYVEIYVARAAIARWIGSESMLKGARRHGMHDRVLLKWLLRDGEIQQRDGGRGSPRRLDPTLIDRAVRATARRVLVWATTLRRAPVRAGYRPLRSHSQEVRRAT